jgi:DNA polymerase-2
VCYGRLGFANSRFGRINAHEAVSFLSRKVITRARAIAEERGFEVHHLYVDSIFVSKVGASKQDFQVLAEEIERETHLPMDFDGLVYPWFAFLSARANPNLGVANRFYGLSPDGEHKIRGIALRRGNTPLFIAKVQLEVLNILAKESDPAKLPNLLPEILELVKEHLSLLKKREVPLEELAVTQTLSRELSKYSVLSPPVAAAQQLQVQGKMLQRGQRVRYVFIAQGPGVCAWDLAAPLDPSSIDVPRYNELVLRAVFEVLEPLGMTKKMLKGWLFNHTSYINPLDVPYSSKKPIELELPLFADLEHLQVDRF